MKTSPSDERIRVGVISDTHGWLRPQVFDIFRGVDLILHAGDIGAETILDALATIAPVRAVRGNVDGQPWSQTLPQTAIVEVGKVKMLLVHDGNSKAAHSLRDGVQVIVSGHSHNPVCEQDDGVLHFNPGSAGPRRFALPVCVGLLDVHGERVEGDIVYIEA